MIRDLAGQHMDASPIVPGPEAPSYSLIIPVFNAAGTLPALLTEIESTFAGASYEVVLVNDGSADDSERVCVELQRRAPARIRFIQLARNFGEHNAVLAGLRHCRGAYAAILDDDGQHPPQEARRLLATLQAGEWDVVYGRYRAKQHTTVRNFGSWLTNQMATTLLQKPPDLYLSSFKAINRFVIDAIGGYRGPSPYVDGLIFGVTRRITQIDVEHRERSEGQSNYGPRKLLALWLDSFLNFSILPLRLSGILGVLSSVLSAIVLVAILIDRAWFNTGITQGVPTMIVLMAFFAGIQFLILGTIGEYLGRLFLHHTGAPQFVVRYVLDADEPTR